MNTQSFFTLIVTTIFTLIVTTILWLLPQPSGANTILFSEDFSDNSAGWTLGTEWEIGPATASSGHNYGNPDPATDHTPTSDNGVAGVVIGGNASTGIHAYYYLTSPVVNTNVPGDISLEFYRWLNSDYSPYMQNRVELWDGSQWRILWETGVEPGIQDSSWTQMLFNITPYKTQEQQLRMGFLVGSTGVYTVSSWNIDDVSFFVPTAPVPLPATVLLLGSGLIGLAGFRKKFKK